MARNAWQVVFGVALADLVRQPGSFGTPNYYVQKMYAANQGTHVLRLAVDGSEKNAADHA